MPKPLTFPVLYDNLLQIDISKLKEWGYLVLNRVKRGVIKWSNEEEEIAGVSITVNMLRNELYVELSYDYRSRERRYKLSLISVNSNLNKGVVWYFICPKTNKRCRKLYLVDGYFLHRKASGNFMYESQTYSKKYRNIEKSYGVYFKLDSLYSELYEKHFKKTYAGKPTKRYLKIMEQIRRVEKIPFREIERLLSS